MNDTLTVNELLTQLNDSYFVIKLMGAGFSILIGILAYFLKDQIRSLKNVVKSVNALQVTIATDSQITRQNTKDIDDLKSDVKSLFKANTEHAKCINYKPTA